MAYPWQTPSTPALGAFGGSGVAPAVGWLPSWQQPWEASHAPGAQPAWHGRAALPEIPPPALSSSLSQSRLIQIEALVAGLEHKLAQAPHIRSKLQNFEDVQGDLMDLQSQLAYLMEAQSAAEASRSMHGVHWGGLRPDAVQAPTLTSSPSAGMLPTPPHSRTPSSARAHASALPPPPAVVVENGLSVAFSIPDAYRNGAPLQPSQDQDVSLMSTCHALQNRINTMERSQSDLQQSSGRLANETRRLSQQRLLLMREQADVQAEQAEQARELAQEVVELRESEEALRHELAKAQSVAAIADAQRCFAEEVHEQQCMADQERVDWLQQHVNRNQAELFEARQAMQQQEQGAQDAILEMQEHFSTLLNTSASSSLLEFEGNLMQIRDAQANRCARVNEMERQMAVARASAASFSCRQGHELQRPRWALPLPPQQPSPLGMHRPRHLRSPSSSSTLRDFPGFSLASSSSTPRLTPRRFPRSLASSAEAPAKLANYLPGPPSAALRLPGAPCRSLSSPATSRILPQPPVQQDAAALPAGAQSFFVDFAERVRELNTDIAEVHAQNRSCLEEGDPQHQRIEELERELQLARAQAQLPTRTAGQLSSSAHLVAAERRAAPPSQAAARERVREIARRVGSVPHAPAQVAEQTLPAALPPVHCLALQEALREEESEEEAEAEVLTSRDKAAVANQEVAALTMSSDSALTAGLKAAAAAVEEEDTDADT